MAAVRHRSDLETEYDNEGALTWAEVTDLERHNHHMGHDGMLALPTALFLRLQAVVPKDHDEMGKFYRGARTRMLEFDDHLAQQYEDYATQTLGTLFGREMSRLARDERNRHRWRQKWAHMFSTVRTLSVLETVLLSPDFHGFRAAAMRQTPPNSPWDERYARREIARANQSAERRQDEKAVAAAVDDVSPPSNDSSPAQNRSSAQNRSPAQARVIAINDDDEAEDDDSHAIVLRARSADEEARTRMNAVIRWLARSGVPERMAYGSILFNIEMAFSYEQEGGGLAFHETHRQAVAIVDQPRRPLSLARSVPSTLAYATGPLVCGIAPFAPRGELDDTQWLYTAVLQRAHERCKRLGKIPAEQDENALACRSSCFSVNSPFQGFASISEDTGDAMCTVCCRIGIRVSSLLKFAERGTWPQHYHGALYQTSCACRQSVAHLTCLLSDGHVGYGGIRPFANEETGYYEFRCFVCGERYDMTYGQSADLEKGAGATRLCFLLFAKLKLYETWLNRGSQGPEARYVLDCPPNNGPHWLDDEELWPKSSWTRYLDALLDELARDPAVRIEFQLMKKRHEPLRLSAIWHALLGDIEYHRPESLDLLNGLRRLRREAANHPNAEYRGEPVLKQLLQHILPFPELGPLTMTVNHFGATLDAQKALAIMNRTAVQLRIPIPEPAHVAAIAVGLIGDESTPLLWFSKLGAYDPRPSERKRRRQRDRLIAWARWARFKQKFWLGMRPMDFSPRLRLYLSRVLPHMPNRPRLPASEATPPYEVSRERYEVKDWVGNDTGVNRLEHLHDVDDFIDSRELIETVNGRIMGYARDPTTGLATRLSLRFTGWRRFVVVGEAVNGKIENFFLVYWPSEIAARLVPDARLHEHQVFIGQGPFRWPDACYLGFEPREKFLLCPECGYDNRLTHTHCHARGCGQPLANVPPTFLTARQRAERADALDKRGEWEDMGIRTDLVSSGIVTRHPFPYDPTLTIRPFPAPTQPQSALQLAVTGRRMVHRPRRRGAYSHSGLRGFRQ